MKRRSFLSMLPGAAGAVTLATGVPGRIAEDHSRSFHYPPSLKAGNTIGLIAPGSPVSEERLEKAVNNLTDLGFHVKLGDHVQKVHGYLAGSDEERLEDLHRMFADPKIHAVWCIRGGYGCTRLLPHLDFNLIWRNPKLFIGYSDITALHIAISKKCRMITIHGPVASADLTTYTKDHLIAVLSRSKYHHVIPLAHGYQAKAEKDPAYNPAVIRPGLATGQLMGGNLSLMAAMVGNPNSISYRKKLVFIEDVGEKPYRIDRMLTQLIHSTDILKASGIVLGVFADCEETGDLPSLNLIEIFRDRFRDFEGPVLSGFSFGHIEDQCSFPVGELAELNTDRMEITLLDAEATGRELFAKDYPY